MKLLVVCSGNRGRISPFVSDQVEALRSQGLDIDYFLIKGRGVTGYLRNLPRLRSAVADGGYDVVHAHFGLSGALAVLQRRVPVVITFHSGDIAEGRLTRRISLWAGGLAEHSIFVSRNNLESAGLRGRSSVIPCGVDTTLFRERDREACKAIMGLDPARRHVLFGGAFAVKRKGPDLARHAVAQAGHDVELIELSGYSRAEVATLINASEVVLLPSRREGSPQIVKEAMACNVPVVATDVGDVRERFGDLRGHFMSTRDPDDVARKLRQALAFGGRTNARPKILEMDNQAVARRLHEIYDAVAR